MKIGLYFGSFNPVHIGHVAIAQYMVEYTNMEELWFVVSPQNPLKERKNLLDDYQRLEMVVRAIEPYSNMRASSVEFNMPKPSYTINTLAYLHDKYPQHEFVLIMGGDNIASLTKWKNYEYLLQEYNIYVYSRPNIEIPKEFLNHPSITYVIAPLMELSSSFIRKSIKEGKNIRAFMPESAWQYLDEMNFYKK